MANKIDDPSSALTAEEQLALAHVARGLRYTPPAPPEAPADPRWALWQEATDALEVSLSSSLDTSVRRIEFDTLMAPYAEGGQWFGAPKAAREQAERRVRASQDQRSGEHLHALESWLMTHGPAVEEALRQVQGPEDPVALAVQNGYDPLGSATLVETRLLRREPFLGRSLPSARARVYVDHPASIEQLVDNMVIEQLLDSGEGPGTTDPGEIAAHEGLRRRVKAIREARVPDEAKRLMETLAVARRAASRARQLHHINPVVRRKEPTDAK
jgi:hypothetical protein